MWWGPAPSVACLSRWVSAEGRDDDAASRGAAGFTAAAAMGATVGTHPTAPAVCRPAMLVVTTSRSVTTSIVRMCGVSSSGSSSGSSAGDLQ